MNPLFKMIDWNTIAEVVWQIVITGAIGAYLCSLRTVAGYIFTAFLILLLIVQAITVKKSDSERATQTEQFIGVFKK